MRRLKKHPGFTSYEIATGNSKMMRAFIILILSVLIVSVGYSILEGMNTIDRAAPFEGMAQSK